MRLREFHAKRKELMFKNSFKRTLLFYCYQSQLSSRGQGKVSGNNEQLAKEEKSMSSLLLELLTPV
jgi:hypothetical protein